MAVVEFVVTDWREAYPQFDNLLTDAQVLQAWDIACLILDNSDSSPVPYDPEHGVEVRRILLWLLVCHICSLALRPVTQTGYTSSATEGSVSISFTIPQYLNGQYFTQTPCGETYWQAIKKYVIGGKYYDVKKNHPWG